jgi:hypothetical protein
MGDEVAMMLRMTFAVLLLPQGDGKYFVGMGFCNPNADGGVGAGLVTRHT